MTQEGLTRKLTAILSADAESYSRLMGDDEDATIRTLTSYIEAMRNCIQEHRGRVVDAPGDNLLAEFASVVDAVSCAAAIQKRLFALNAKLPEERKMQFRIGINLGDVVAEGDRIYGDGVNIAARLEGLAEGGGICISRSAYDQVKNKLDLGYKYLGEHTVKNIADPVRVYRVLMAPEAAGKVLGEKRSGLKQWHLGVVAVSVLILVATAAAIWYVYFQSEPSDETAALEPKTASSMSEKPAIAVLPFKNLSQDPQQEYFSDGITNDIITDLSKFRNLFVIASNTVFTYKGKSVKITELGKELSVQYVLEGSVQAAGERVRINAQLIDATIGNQIWAQRYDRSKKDLFTLQDEIIETIVRTLEFKIETAELIRVMHKDTTNYQAYDYLIRGTWYRLQSTRSSIRKARQMFEKAIELDSQYASAYTALGWCYHLQVEFGWTEFIEQTSQRAVSLAQKALSLDDFQPSAHELLGSIYIRKGQYDLAIAELQQALNLNPNDALFHSEMGEVLLYAGQTDTAIKFMETGLRFNPRPEPGIYMELGLAYYLKKRYEDAVKALQKGLAKKPDFVGHLIVLTAAYAQLGNVEDAKLSAQKVLRRHPFFEVESYGTIFQILSDRKHLRDGLRKAGLK
ncbi:MAG: tetratricopeptide repeat protein [Desulfobacterales bacterium]|jgi:adenylate cyclase